MKDEGDDKNLGLCAAVWEKLTSSVLWDALHTIRVRLSHLLIQPDDLRWVLACRADTKRPAFIGCAVYHIWPYSTCDTVNDSWLKPRASKTDSETLSEIQESRLTCDKINYWM